jgi:DNA polymerase elongation subunit (family B)
MKIQLINIANVRRDIYLFQRTSNGNLKIDKVNDFFPFYYEPDKSGKFVGYDGTMLRKVYVSQPSDIAKTKSFASYSSDIKFTSNFLIHKITEILPTTPKYCFIDIEILADELPSVSKPTHPISCISIYNSFDKSYKTWFLGDYSSIDKEKDMLLEFVAYLKKEQFDLILGWNIVNFDYPYIYNRLKYFKIDFAKEISPIHSMRTCETKEVFYPNGTSIVDYYLLFKKVFMREASYTLDYVGEKHLGKGKIYKNVDFSVLDDIIKKRNLGDVVMLAELEEQKKLLPYYDEIRRMVKCQWEDLYHNSRLVEMLLLEEAKLHNVVLPNKENNNKIEKNEDEVGFQGATRDGTKTGLFTNISKCDLGSAYPSMIFNFCLDTKNIITDESELEMYGGVKINDVCFRQNTDRLLPSIVKKILIIKDSLKLKKKQNKEDKIIAIKYDAIKAIVNSVFGVMGSPYFRLFNLKIASSITYLVRDLLMYVKEKVEKEGIEVIYWDTDSLFLNAKEDLSKKLNQYIQDWGKEKYGKKSIDLKFEYEGYFKSLFVLGSCHYMGYIEGKKNPEIKGIEAKRSSSTKYEAFFQETLLKKILSGDTKENIDIWISNEQERITTLPIEQIGFPCKISSKDYKAYPIFVRAKDNTLKIQKNFKLNLGELYYYIFVKSNYEVLAFTKENKDFINKNDIDYSRVIERNIFNKVEKIYEALNWYFNKNIHQKVLF